MKSRSLVCFGSAVQCAVTYVYFAALAYMKYPLLISPFRNWLSDLGNQVVNPKGAVFYNIGVILTALCLAVWFTAGLSEWRLKGNAAHRRLLVISQAAGVLSAVALTMSALYPINLPQVHSFWSRIHFMMFGMGFGFSVAALRYHPRFTRANLCLGIVTALMPCLMLVLGSAYVLEWVAVGCIIAYMLSIGIASLTFTSAENRKWISNSANL